jgi:hypothetical protein
VRVESGRGGYPHRGKLKTRTPTRPGCIGDFSVRTRENIHKNRTGRRGSGRGGSGWADRVGFAHP